MTIKQLIRDSYNHYTKKSERKQWIRKTYYLLQTGKHTLITGVFPRKVM